MPTREPAAEGPTDSPSPASGESVARGAKPWPEGPDEGETARFMDIIRDNAGRAVSPATLTLHGVMMEVCGLGVLIQGPSGIGKGELALELISRGHRFVADDAPQISISLSHFLSGTCPPVLLNLLEVRGLGVLNIAALFGEQAVASSTALQLIVTLETIEASETSERGITGPTRAVRRLLDVDIPEIRLTLRVGRPVALLVETLIKNFKLHQQGYFAHADLSERQRCVMDSFQP